MLRKANVKARPGPTPPLAAAGKRAPKTSAPKARAEAPAGSGPPAVSAEDRHAMIARAAYFRFERRGDDGGCAELDWLEAEAEIDRALSALSGSGAQN